MASGHCQLELNTPVRCVHMLPSTPELENRFALAYSSMRHSCKRFRSSGGSETSTGPLKVHLYADDLQQPHAQRPRRSLGFATRTGSPPGTASDFRRLGWKRHAAPAGVVQHYYGSENFGFTVHDSLVLEASAFTKVMRNRPRDAKGLNDRETSRLLNQGQVQEPDNLSPKSCASEKLVLSELEDSRPCRYSARSPCGASAAQKVMSSPTASEEKPIQRSGSVSGESTGETIVDDDLVRCPTCKECICQDDFPTHYLTHHRKKRKASHGYTARPRKIPKQEPVDDDVCCRSPTGNVSEEHTETLVSEDLRASPSSTDEVIHPVPIRFQVLPHPQWPFGRISPYAHHVNGLPGCSAEVAVPLTQGLIHPAAPPVHPALTVRHPVAAGRLTMHRERQTPHHRRKRNRLHWHGRDRLANSLTTKGRTGRISSKLPHPAVACQLQAVQSFCDSHPASLEASRKKSTGPAVKQEDCNPCKSVVRPVSPGPPPPLISDFA